MNITIREYTESDAAQVAALMDAFHDYLVDIDPNRRLRRLPGYGEAALKEETEAIKDGKGIIHLAFDGERAVGFVIGVLATPFTADDLLGTNPSTRGRVNELYVSDAYRGQGIAKMLVEKVEAWLKEHGCDTVFLGVFAFNTDAIEMYEHIGYSEIERYMMKKLK